MRNLYCRFDWHYIGQIYCLMPIRVKISVIRSNKNGCYCLAAKKFRQNAYCALVVQQLKSVAPVAALMVAETPALMVAN